jgi:type II secretory pathway pseudopilin PulG
MQDSLNPQAQQQQQDHQQSHLQQQQQQQQGDHQQTPQQQQQPRPVLSDEVGVAAALTASFLATDEALTTDDGCTATAVLLEGCGDGGLLLRVANVGDSLALMVDLRRYVSVCRGEGGLSMLAEFFVGGAGRGAGGVWGRGAAAEGGICGEQPCSHGGFEEVRRWRGGGMLCSHGSGQNPMGHSPMHSTPSPAK